MSNSCVERVVATATYESACGKLLLGAYGEALCLCTWHDMPCAVRVQRRIARLLNARFEERPSRVLEQTMRELDECFSLRRTAFDVPLLPVGTPFQQQVWQVLQAVPYGTTKSYLDVARSIDNVRGIRAVAQAIGANAIGILIPCHRIVGSGGKLTGFAGGLAAKATLLELEHALPARVKQKRSAQEC